MSEKFINHPFEEIFDIEPGTTLIQEHEIPESEVVKFNAYDDKDIEIEAQFETIYNAAFAAFSSQVMSMDRGQDPGNSHKNLEVANHFLTTALNAAKEKASLKQHKEKLQPSLSSSTNITNNNLIIDRNELLKQLMQRE